MGAVSDADALLLRATDSVRFVPDGLNADSGSITYRAWDQTDLSIVAGARINVDAGSDTDGNSTWEDTVNDFDVDFALDTGNGVNRVTKLELAHFDRTEMNVRLATRLRVVNTEDPASFGKNACVTHLAATFGVKRCRREDHCPIVTRRQGINRIATLI